MELNFSISVIQRKENSFLFCFKMTQSDRYHPTVHRTSFEPKASGFTMVMWPGGDYLGTRCQCLPQTGQNHPLQNGEDPASPSSPRTAPSPPVRSSQKPPVVHPRAEDRTHMAIILAEEGSCKGKPYLWTKYSSKNMTIVMRPMTPVTRCRVTATVTFGIQHHLSRL